MRDPDAPARRALFPLVALALPLAFFLLVEGGLRLAGFGASYPLFVPAPQDGRYLQASPVVAKRFFADPELAPNLSIETGYFLARKPEGSLRIAVQGGSSAAGFPYGYGASLAGMLEQRLRQALPGRQIEVISTAMSAVNSYALLDFVDEIIAQEPDAVLIYAGHNEYLGILGVGSAYTSGHTPALTRLNLALGHLRIYQALQRLISRRATPAPEGGGTLMARVARERKIPFNSDLYRAGLEQFRGNLARLSARYRRAEIPLFLATLASNERDQPPFESALAPGVDAEAWQAAFAAGVVALEAGRFEEAGYHLDEALALDPLAANGWFQRARLRERQQNFADARSAYLAAKDCDQLRFRAPEAFNEVVHELSGLEGVYEVDVQGRFGAASPDGIIGGSLMLEHVHPNLDGYFLLADAFFDALLDTGILGEPRQSEDEALARARIPVSEVDRLFGEYKLERVLSDWPFRVPAVLPVIPEPTTTEQRLASEMYHRRLGWPQAMSELMSHYKETGNDEEYARVALILADAFPYVQNAQFSAGTTLIRAGRAPEALHYLSLSARLTPDDVNALLAFSHALILTGNHKLAEGRLRRVLELDPQNATAIQVLGQIESWRRGAN